MKIDRFDHMVFTVRDIERTCEFYTRVLGMEVITFGGGRRALRFGDQKINLHLAGAEFEPKADPPVPGSEDVCLITKTDLDEALAHVESCGVEIIEGPGEREERRGGADPLFLFSRPGREFDRDIDRREPIKKQRQNKWIPAYATKTGWEGRDLDCPYEVSNYPTIPHQRRRNSLPCLAAFPD